MFRIRNFMRRFRGDGSPWFGDSNPYLSPAQPMPESEPIGLMPKRQWTEEEIFEVVADVLVDALGVDRDEVVPQASLVRDLGAG